MSASTVHNAIITQLGNNSAIITEFTTVSKGVAKNINITSVGRILSVIFISSTDLDTDAAQSIGLSSPVQKVLSLYSFYIAVAFYEPDDSLAEQRKAGYDKMIRDGIDSDLTFGGVCIGLTNMGKLSLAESPDAEGLYYGIMPVVCYRREERGNR